MKQKIMAFHQDADKHWVADLECGHRQHMRHDPPWTNREWVMSEQGRASKIDTEIDCKRCDSAALAAGEAVRGALLQVFNDTSEEGGIQGLCSEGRIELALDKLRTMDLRPILEKAITEFVAREREARLKGLS